MTAREKWEQLNTSLIKVVASSGFQNTVQSFPYPEEKWDKYLSNNQMLAVLEYDQCFYEPCGESIIDSSEQMLIALSGVSLKWRTELNRSSTFNRYNHRWVRPYLIWRANIFTIERLHQHAGPYVPKVSAPTNSYLQIIHEGLNTLDDAKTVCARWMLENAKNSV